MNIRKAVLISVIVYSPSFKTIRYCFTFPKKMQAGPVLTFGKRP